MTKTILKLAPLALLLSLGVDRPPVRAQSGGGITLSVLGTYSAGAYNVGAAEIGAYDPQSRRLFVVDGAQGTIDVLDISNPAAPRFLFAIDCSLGPAHQANSVAVKDGIVAVAVEADVKTDPGWAAFFDVNGTVLGVVQVGALPDMITFTPDGLMVLTANEGEPDFDDWDPDPEGSVSIIDLRGARANLARGLRQSDVTTAGFTQFNSVPLDPTIRIFGPRATVAQDLEPEYIAVSDDSTMAWVTLQENNAIGVLDLRRREFTRLIGLGAKNHMLPGNGLDPSDRDGPNNGGSIKIGNWPVFGMYQPDSIAFVRINGQGYLLTANEGDSRGFPGFNEEARVSTLTLDPSLDQTLKQNAKLGRLTVTTTVGDPDRDGDYDFLAAFGARSFSIWTTLGVQLFDSGDQFEQITAAAFPTRFNADHTDNGSSTFDNRSDNKGPEPEGLTVGTVNGRVYAFIGLERMGGVMVYELTDPVRFVQYVNPRNFNQPAGVNSGGDLGPEGVLFIRDVDSPTRQPLLVTTNEISGTTTIYAISSP